MFWLRNKKNNFQIHTFIMRPAIVLPKEEKANCLTLIVFLISNDFKYSAALPRGAMGWSVVCDCSIPDPTLFSI